MPEQCFEDKWVKFQKDLRDLGVKVSLAFHQICTLISPRAFWKSAELQDFAHHNHIPCSPQGKRLLQASFGRRACSSKEARWDLGLFSFFPLCGYKLWNLECMLQPFQALSIDISRSTWLYFDCKKGIKVHIFGFAARFEIVTFRGQAVMSSFGWCGGTPLFS